MARISFKGMGLDNRAAKRGMMRGRCREDLLELEERALDALENNSVVRDTPEWREEVQWIADEARAMLDQQVEDALAQSA